MARPKVTIDYTILKGLCQIQCTGEECAAVLEIDYDTLNAVLKREGHKCFSEYYKKHSAGGRASLRRRQFEMSKTNPAMAIWLGKQYLDQKDRSDTEIRQTISEASNAAFPTEEELDDLLKNK